MDTAFKASDKYRKYLIGLQFDNLNLYTIWGTDMDDQENDKLLVNDTQLIAFKSLANLGSIVSQLQHSFHDTRNLKKWLEEESFENVYNNNDFRYLINFNTSLHKNRNALIPILNLIQDFFIQVNDEVSLEILENKVMIDFKDYVYNNCFWKKEKELFVINFDIDMVKVFLEQLYFKIYDNMKII